MADKINVDMIVKAIAEGFEDVGGKIGGLNKQTEETDRQSKKTKGSLLELYAGIQLAGQAAEIAKAAFDKMFEAGQRGAMVEQTSQSFELLAKTAETTADVLLGKMADASRGTVDNMTMMSSTLTLTAGVSKEMQIALVEAAPTLMEIAKAANKVNPSLGDTAHLYESIATGIKRGSPLILDNLGIVVKVGEANEEYAKAVGKAVDQLTAEEKILALLNATQKAGNTLIQQAGGDVGSLTDEYEKFKAELKNTGDEMKRNATPAITEFVKELNDVLLAVKTLAAWNRKYDESVKDHSKTIVQTSETYDEYLKRLQETSRWSKDVFEHMTSRSGNATYARRLEAIGYLTEEQYNAAKSQAYWNNEADRYQKQSDAYIKSITATGEEIFNLTILTEEQRKEWDKAQDAAKKYIDRLIDGPWGDLFDDHNADMDDLVKKQSALQGELDKLTSQGYGPLSDKVKDVTAKLDENKKKQEELTKARQDDINMMIYQKASQDMSAEAALVLAEHMGLIDETTRQVDEAMLKMKDAADLNRDGIITAGEETKIYIDLLMGLRGELDRLDGKVSNSFVYVHTLSASTGIGIAGVGQGDGVRGLSGTGTFTSGHRDSGGPVFAGQTYWVGERGPEPVTFPADGHITPAQTSQKQSDALDELNRNFDWFRRSFGSELRDAFLLARDSG
jgi:hypothetical protein